jgi:hypothetical protein
MKAAIIGFVSGVVIILIFVVFKRIDKKTIYGLILAVIGFLYVGFTWSDIGLFSINTLQAIFFLFLAYYGIKSNSYILIAGYFLHGIWDLIYSQVANTALIPPHYDLFCSTLDFTVGLYLLIIKYQLGVKAKV